MMKKTILILLVIGGSTQFTSCSQKKENAISLNIDKSKENIREEKQERHNYGGWYCPDNLNGFPAVAINNWKNVPVVNGRLPTREETQNGSALIYVDPAKFPNAKPLNMQMPKLASYFNESSKKDELVIVIQALNILKDTVVGFRYLNGGNGSARLNEIKILKENEINQIAASNFVSLSIQIKAPQKAIWDIITNPGYYSSLQDIFDPQGTANIKWNNSSKVNFKYVKPGVLTSEFAANLYGNHYIQMDFKQGNDSYVEKFLLLENEETKSTELKIVCGPYSLDEFETQNEILKKWAQKVKEFSEY